MWYNNIFIELEKIKDLKQSEKMAKYMQNKFYFLGINKPKLKEFFKPYLKESKKETFAWNFIDECWEKNYREAQYLGIEYLLKNVKYISDNDLNHIKYLIINKSWWDTVDMLDFAVGEIVKKNNKLFDIMIEWSRDQNIWLRRVAIDFQQRYKEKTNFDILKRIILNNINSNEFFINKAIGWSLREYSKYNPNEVKMFILNNYNNLNKLSIREATKYIDL